MTSGHAVRSGRRVAAKGRFAAPAYERSLAFPLTALGSLAVFATALAMRALEARGALLYPDGYQYLLMARGIGAHLRPVIRLGPRGELFVPNADAAMKPLLPALVALLHVAGVGWTGAARAVSVVSAGAAVALSVLVAARLTGSRVLAIFAAVVVLCDPVERYWAAFSSPDPLGQALMLGAVLAVLHRRVHLGGLLAGLTLFARPELGLLLIAGGVVLAVRPEHRNRALGFLTASLTTAALVLAVVRPPLQLGIEEVALAVCGALAAAALALLAPSRVGVVIGLAVLAAVGTRGTSFGQLAIHDPAVVVLFVGGIVVARASRPAAVIAVAAGALAVAFETRNGTSTRYLAELVPLAAVSAAVGLRRIASTAPAVAAATGTACLAALVLVAPAPAPGPDLFSAVAPQIPQGTAPVLTSAADAYGFLLYPRSVRSLAPGSRGLLLVDATTRAYEPGLSVTGRVLARLAPGDGFVAPGGRLDLAPAVLIEGRVR